MGIFDRLSTLIRSNISDLIARAENPEKMLNQLIVDMRSQLAKAKQQVAGAIADEKRLAAQVEQEKKSAEDWEKRAVLAVQEGHEDLSGASLVKQFRGLGGRADTDQQLLALKQKLGLLPAGSPAAAKQLGKGAKEAELVQDDDAEPSR